MARHRCDALRGQRCDALRCRAGIAAIFSLSPLAIRNVREPGFYIYEHAAMPESLAIANAQRFPATAIAIAKRGPLRPQLVAFPHDFLCRPITGGRSDGSSAPERPFEAVGAPAGDGSGPCPPADLKGSPG